MKQRTITVLERISPTRVRIRLEQTAYLKEGIKLECQTNSNNNKKCLFTVRAIKPQPIELKVEAGNVLRLYRDARLGHSGACMDMTASLQLLVVRIQKLLTK